MARAFLTPTSTISNDNWTSSPDVGADLHLNVDGATYSPLDADEGTGLISGTASSSCSFGFPALPALATDHQWTNIRVAYFTQFLTVENYKFALRVKVGANIIGQTSDHITNGTVNADITSWFAIDELNQAKLANAEQISFLIEMTNPFVDDMQLYGVEIEFLSSITEEVSGGVKSGGTALLSSSNTFFGEGGAKVDGASYRSLRVIEYPTGSSVLSGISLFSKSYYITTISGGLKLSGEARPKIGLVSSGGVLVNGSQISTSIYNVIITGGIFAGGRAFLTDDEESLGGVEIGGTSFVSKSQNESVSGGAIAGGDLPLSFTGVGEVGVAGIAGVRATYVYNTVNKENDFQIGGLVNPAVNFIIPAGGEVAVQGAAGIKASFRYNSSGGINVQGESSLAISRVNSKEFTFNVRSKQTLTATEFKWNTGSIPLSHFRIVSKCMPEDSDICQPISDPEDGCLRHTVATITASTPADVCRQLSERGFKFPIVGFDRFARPAQNDQLAANTASGEFNGCNELIPVEFCEVPDCLEFCVDFDAILLIKPFLSFDFTKVREYIGDGVIAISGTASAVFSTNNIIVTENVEGGILLGGVGPVVTPFNRYVASGGITIQGTVGGEGVKSTVYKTSSSLCPTETIPAFFRTVEQRDSGSTWTDDNRIFASDNVKAYASVSDNNLSKSLVGSNASINVPEGKVVEGIIVEIEKSGGGAVFDGEVVLVGPNGIKSQDRSSIFLWPLTDEFIIHGQADDNWGREWTREEVNSSEFGVSIRANSISGISQNAQIDSIKISVAVCEEDGSGRIDISGSAVQKSSHYSFVASGGLAVAGGLTTLAEYAYVAEGGLSVAGSYAHSISAGIVGTSDTSQMEIGGGLTPLDFKASTYSYDNFGGTTGGTSVSSEFTELNVISSGWTWVVQEEPISIGGSALYKIGFKYIADDTPISIGGSFSQDFYYEGNGTIRVGPEFDQAVIPIFSRLAFGYNPSGDGISIGDFGALIKFSDLGIFEVGVEANIKLAEINAIFGSVDVGETLVPVDTVLTTCGRGCIDLPLTIDMNHNLIQNNKLSQFLSRNNLFMSSVIPLSYNKVNDCWQANSHFNGVSSFGNRESWNIVFELQCSSFISGVELGQSMLRFGVSIIQKNLDSGEDYDTRVMSIFDPLDVCQRDSELIFRLTIDSKLKSTVVTPESTVQDTIVHDNIGLFKTGFWHENPDILFNISEVGTELPARFIDVTPFVNY